LIIYDFDSQAFAATAGDKHGFEFAALYTLQHGLTRDTQFHGCFQHGQVFRWGILSRCESGDATRRCLIFGNSDPWRHCGKRVGLPAAKLAKTAVIPGNRRAKVFEGAQRVVLPADEERELQPGWVDDFVCGFTSKQLSLEKILFPSVPRRHGFH
jgi:hypothetical protein